MIPHNKLATRTHLKASNYSSHQNVTVTDVLHRYCILTQKSFCIQDAWKPKLIILVHGPFNSPSHYFGKIPHNSSHSLLLDLRQLLPQGYLCSCVWRWSKIPSRAGKKTKGDSAHTNVYCKILGIEHRQTHLTHKQEHSVQKPLFLCKQLDYFENGQNVSQPKS